MACMLKKRDNKQKKEKNKGNKMLRVTEHINMVICLYLLLILDNLLKVHEYAWNLFVKFDWKHRELNEENDKMSTRLI